MVRTLLSSLIFACVVVAQDRYDFMVEEAHVIAHTQVVGEHRELRLRRAVNHLGKAAQLESDRWPAWYWRGVYRADTASAVRALLETRLDLERTLGATTQTLERHRAVAQWHIDLQIQLAAVDFANMARALRSAGSHGREERLFANATLKFNDRALEDTGDGQPGAISDLKALLAERVLVPQVLAMLARSYMLLGEARTAAAEYEKAELYWRQALRYAPTSNLRHQILGNLTATYEMDNRHLKAEETLHQHLRLDPSRAETWKNLGLVLGLQARLREALVCYTRVIELGRAQHGGYALVKRHGNAWLRSATIHGTLLPDDGDVLLAWRLFLEYRSVHGDDYNFSLAFADFCFEHEQYELALRYFEHAKRLRPFCIHAYQRLVEVAARLPGSGAERAERSRAALAEFHAAQDRYVTRDVPSHLRRICGGISETFRPGPQDGQVLAPDPLKGHGPTSPPSWTQELAASRARFRPYDPELDGGTLKMVFATKAEGTGTAVKSDKRGASRWLTLGVPVVCGVGAVFLLIRWLFLIRRTTRVA